MHGPRVLPVGPPVVLLRKPRPSSPNHTAPPPAHCAPALLLFLGLVPPDAARRHADGTALPALAA